MDLTNTEGDGGDIKDEVVVAELEGETKETMVVDQEEEDVCPVCIEALQKDTNKFARMICCGKGMHLWCSEGIKVSSLSHEQKNSCPLCRTTYPDGDEERIEQLRPWVEKGKAWAQNLLGERYEMVLVLINPTNERESCSS